MYRVGHNKLLGIIGTLSFLGFAVFASVQSNPPLETIENVNQKSKANGLHSISPAVIVSWRSLGADPKDWLKLKWMDKASTLLRAGQHLGSNDDIQALLKMSREQIVDLWVNDARFVETVLDFNLYFMGQKPAALHGPDGTFSRAVYHYPNAISAAKSLIDHSDYLKLLELDQPIFIPPLVDPIWSFTSHDYSGLTPEQIRVEQSKWILDYFDQQIQYLTANPNATMSDFCSKFDKDAIIDTEFFVLGIDGQFTFYLGSARGAFNSIINMCFIINEVPKGGLLATIKTGRRVSEEILKTLNQLDPSVYPPPKTVDEIRSFDYSKIIDPKLNPWSFVNINTSTYLQNSSTNFNRRRAAHILDRFFCDDLIPINVTAPAGHASGMHASDPACQSCHYKLDPMAGFFKNYGYLFVDHSDMSYIRFDDGAAVDLSSYQTNWPVTGYIRSTDFDDKNEYGDNLRDLFEIIKKAPETKRCLVKRMFEYFVDPKQAVDAGYLDELTQNFVNRAKTDSVDALKQTVKTLVLSKTFSEPDPLVDQCYDFATGFNPKDAPPCKVAYLIQKNCATCHGPTSQKGGLDLTRWIQMPDGKYSFYHVDHAGQQQPRDYTIQSFIDLINTQDPDQRMPLYKYMSSGEREELYLWAVEEIKK